MTYTILVCGGRKYNDREALFLALDGIVSDFYLPTPHGEDLPRGFDLRIVNGGASGADKLATEWAKSRCWTFKEYPAQWDDIEVKGAVIRTRPGGKKYNVLAGHWRNRKMLNEEKIDLVLAAPGGTGTANMCRIAEEAGIEVRKI